jgi:hypothetical protein
VIGRHRGVAGGTLLPFLGLPAVAPARGLVEIRAGCNPFLCRLLIDPVHETTQFRHPRPSKSTYWSISSSLRLSPTAKPQACMNPFKMTASPFCVGPFTWGGGACRCYSATGLMPWRTTKELPPGCIMPSCYSATALMPWRTCGSCRGRAFKLVLLFGHGTDAVENRWQPPPATSKAGCFYSATALVPWRTGTFGMAAAIYHKLLFGHGTRAVENPADPEQHVQVGVPSIRPRH